MIPIVEEAMVEVDSVFLFASMTGALDPRVVSRPSSIFGFPIPSGRVGVVQS